MISKFYVSRDDKLLFLCTLTYEFIPLFNNTLASYVANYIYTCIVFMKTLINLQRPCNVTLTQCCR